MAEREDMYGLTSPGGFVFGVSGWNWGEPRPKTITFFLDNTAKVSDQHGRPIKGAVIGTKEVKFAQTAPSPDDPPEARKGLATHLEVIEVLVAENVNWQTLTLAGWPQIPYAQLKSLKIVPPTPLEELRKIKDATLRKDAMRFRRECDEARIKEAQEVEAE